MSLLHSVAGFFTAISLALTGAWDNLLESNRTVVGSAASVAVSLPQNVDVVSKASYASLLNALNSPLNLSNDEAPTASSTDSAEPTDLAEAIVNIYCTQKTDQYRKTVSGTGFFISERGVVLTNAHVGQFLLLEKSPTAGETKCQVKTGEKAAATYEVDLLYISPSWLIEQADLISDPTPRGSGENDFALLYITGRVDGEQLPKSFPFLPPATSPLSNKYRKATVILVGYPSTEDYSGKRITATTTITSIFTFKTGYADILTLGASPLGHHGASGGPVIDSLGRAIGVITTKQSGTTILNAITIPHIDRALQTETNSDLISTISGNLDQKARIFNETVSPILQSLLTENLE